MIVNVHLKIMQRKTFDKKVGNKSDLRHLRTVERTEAQKLVDGKYKIIQYSYICSNQNVIREQIQIQIPEWQQPPKVCRTQQAELH